MRVTQTRRIERAGVNALRGLLEENDQIVQEIDGGNDYGEDLLVMLTEGGYRTGVCVAIQVKSGQKYKRANGYAIPVDGHAEDWRNSIIPVFGVVYDIDSGKLFWTNISQALREGFDPPPWISLRGDRELSGATVGDFLREIHEYAHSVRSKGGTRSILQVRPIRGAVRHPAGWFVGREEQSGLLRRILSRASDRKLLLTGMAGVGKTSLVDKVVEDPSVRAAYPGGLVFVDMNGFTGDRRRMGRPEDAYAPVLSALGVPVAELPVEVGLLATFYHDLLDRRAAEGSPVLLVFDNVAQLSQVAELMPRADVHGLVVTSRIRLGVMDGVECVSLDCMTAEESDALFRSVLSPSRWAGAGGEGARLWDLCGRLPLAMRIAAAILKEDPSLGVCDLVEELAEARTRLDVLRYGDTAVRAALEVSFRHLDEDLREPFCRLSVNPTPRLSEEIAAVLMGVPAARARAMLRRIGQASLLSRDSSERWVLHDLVYLFGSEKADELIDAARRHELFDEMAKRYYEISEEADRALRSTRRSGSERFTSIGEALAWFDAEHMNLKGTALRASNDDLAEDAYFLFMQLVLFLDMRGLATEAFQCATGAYEAARACKNVEWQVRALNNVGLCLTARREFDDAIRKLTQAVAIAERVGFLDGQCDANTSLGAAVRQRRSPAAAIPILMESVRLARRTGSPVKIGAALTNLGTAFRESGRLKEAGEVLAESILFHKASGDLRKEASAHGGLALVFSDHDRFESALRSYQDSLAAYRAVQDEFGVALAHLNLGATHLRMGDATRATEALEYARARFEEMRDDFHLAGVLANLGNVRRMVGDVSGSAGFYRASREIFERIGMPERVEFVDSLLWKQG
ncbi:tetratricopeptide repeat protein [Kitasatospora xanthocidica]|uniref:tetratricopeptide repeat protein n=1 Tax=Kitasatospora xanthocidica TaxID=83382 RepID=UPI0036EDFB0C